MTVDHINKFLLNATSSSMFALGRLSMPLFAFVLAYNLARPGALENGVYWRIIKKLVFFGAVAVVPLITLDRLLYGWWPFNIMFTLALSTGCIYLLKQGKKFHHFFIATLIFVIGGALVEFCWPAMLICITAWSYCMKPGRFWLVTWLLSTATLFFVNLNFWALATIPIIFIAPYVHLRVPRIKLVFYIYYPAHLYVLWVLKILLST